MRRDTHLADLLVQRGWLTLEERREVERMVERNLKRYGSDVRRSLGAVAGPGVRQVILSIDDAELQQSLSTLPPAPNCDLFATGGQLIEQRLRYSLTRLHGEGGLGLVYVAHDNDLNRDVALKEMRPERADHPEMWRRFLKEAQITGQLEHPNIVPVYELARRLEDNQPFYTMRFVKGQTLQEVLKEHHRRLREGQEDPLALHRLLTAFISVCQAVGYAHARGVIHRDLKPTNVVLGSFGEVVVLDWGLAKTLDATEQASDAVAVSAEAQSEDTQAGQVLGSPAYMSPEQAEGRTDLIDARTDVYGLGAMLFEILTGAPPHRGKDTAEVLQQIVHGDTPRARMKAVPPALDAICARAMAKDRRERYVRATELAEEIQRFLADEPVRAFGESVAVRASRWARKHKPMVATAAAILLTATVGLAVGLYVVNAEKNRTELARQGEETQRIEADKNGREARERESEIWAVLDFVENRIFAAARPEGQEGGLGPAITLRQAVESALPFVDKSFTRHPLIEARLRNTLGISFWYLGEAQKAARQLEEATRLNTEHRGLDHPDTLSSMHNLAASYVDLRRYAEAVKLNEKVLALRKARLGVDDPETLKSMNSLANNYLALGRPTEALKLYEETLALRKARLGPTHPHTLATMNNLALSLLNLGRAGDAVKLYEETLALQKATLPPNHVDTAASMSNLGLAYCAVGRLTDAIKALEEAVAIQKAKLGPGHVGTLETMLNLANCYGDAGRYADALKLHESSLKLRGARLGIDHPYTLFTMRGVAVNLIRLRRGAEAVPVIDECLKRIGGKVVHPQLIPNLLDLRLRHFQKCKDGAGCRTTAEMWEHLKRTDAASLYDAACMRAVTAAVCRAADRSPAGARQADAEADRAMTWLTEAVAGGYKDAAHMAKDEDLAVLRGRNDFRKLVTRLEAKTKR
jgi:tetratricopeptide (TPR) repeat protein/tRNA A-37 threonylcarbamoyl transferase component Bud32